MRARVLLNLLLLAAAGLLGWWVYREVQEEDRAERVAAFAPGSVRTITVERNGEPVLRLRRDGERWLLVEPRQLPASEFHVRMLLRFLELPVEQRYPRGELDLAAVGLRAPKAVIAYDDARFAFGELEPLSGRRYVLRDDSVLLLTEGVSALAGSPWWNFIERRLLPHEAEVAAVETADGRRLTAERFRTLAARWQEASANVVKPIRPGVSGTDLYVELADGTRLRWQVVDGDQPRLLRPDLGLAYHVGADTLAVLSGKRTE